MEYRGLVAVVEFDDSTDVLHGRAVNGGPYPVATFEATHTRALRREFERSVDEYLGWCEEDCVEPRKATCGEIELRLGVGLHAEVEMAAGAEGMSVDAWIVRALREAVARASDGSEGDGSLEVRGLSPGNAISR